MDEPVEIGYLADCPEFIPTIASWVFRQWGEMYRMKSVNEQIERLSERLNKNRFPIAFVALAGSAPVGTASLKIQEMTTHKHLYHWLGTVYVVESYRNHGIGAALVDRSVAEARKLGVKSLYLHTPDKEEFYLKRRWVPVERPIYYDMPVVIMKKELVV